MIKKCFIALFFIIVSGCAPEYTITQYNVIDQNIDCYVSNLNYLVNKKTWEVLKEEINTNPITPMEKMLFNRSGLKTMQKPKIEFVLKERSI
ncbi:MAG: hypothetical protein HRT68_16820, partial [Flavobacteriaceae bacterium]|nr:hypothetical protein [Flavobacteriaceae bacterium]